MSFCEPCLRTCAESAAAFFCPACDEYMCGTCREHHSKFKLLLNHRIERLELTSPHPSSGDNSVAISPVEEALPDRIEKEHIAVEQEDVQDYLNKDIVAEMRLREDGVENRTCRSNSNYENVFEKEPPVHDIHVQDTGLARAIGIGSRHCQMALSSDEVLTIRQGAVTFVDINCKMVRRLGRKNNTIVLEIGRAFQYGEGQLVFTSDDAERLHALLCDLFRRK